MAHVIASSWSPAYHPNLRPDRGHLPPRHGQNRGCPLAGTARFESKTSRKDAQEDYAVMYGCD
jgi:hypothetical protein